MPHITINDKPYEIAAGRSILEACREHDIHIPTLCYHPALEPYGGCRLCMVETVSNGRSRLVASCVFPAEDGMVIYTESEVVKRSRRMTMELILAGSYNTPQLLSLGEELGVKEVRFKLPEENACMLCGLCVRACQEVVGVSAISVIHRGISKKVSAPFEISSSRCIGCGTCVLVCPTGAFKLENVAGFQRQTAAQAAYRRGHYFRVGGELDLHPDFVQDVTRLFIDLGSGEPEKE